MQVHLRVTDDYERRRAADPALSIGLIFHFHHDDVDDDYDDYDDNDDDDD